jgi:hypothetical protein
MPRSKRKKGDDDPSPIIIGDTSSVPPFRKGKKRDSPLGSIVFASHPAFQGGTPLSISHTGFLTTEVQLGDIGTFPLSDTWQLHPHPNLTIFSLDKRTVFFLVTGGAATLIEDRMTGKGGIMLTIPGVIGKPFLVNGAETTSLLPGLEIRILFGRSNGVQKKKKKGS